MSLIITSLNSGSNGNCYYIGNEQEAILVDIGISCRETEKRLQRCGLAVEKIKAVFISHEHSDHIKGLEVFARKHRLPVYITPSTLRSGGLKIEEQQTKQFRAYDKINIGALEITAFPKYHDASDPHSFIISGNGITIGVFTDIGSVCNHVIGNFKQCHAAFLEANYDEVMLEDGNYPFFLKNRIRSNHGHLSNRQALELFMNHGAPFLSHVILSHLSRDNNSPQLVQRLFEQHAGKTKVIVASRDYETAVFTISDNGYEAEKEITITEHLQEPFPAPLQMSLF